MHKIIKYFKPYVFPLLAVFALLFVQANTDLALPDYMSNIVSKGIALNDNAYIMKEGVLMLLIALLGVVCAVAVGYIGARVAAGFSMQMRGRIFRKVESFSAAEFDKYSTASLITRSTNDVQQIQMFLVVLLRMVFYAPIIGIGAVIRAVGKSASMSWIIAVAVLVLLGFIVIAMAIVLPKFRLVQKMVDRLNLVAREGLTGMLVIRAFNAQQHEEKRFDEANKDLTGLNLFVNRVMAIMMPMMMLIMNGTALAIIWIATNTITDITQLGNMLAFIQYAMQIIMSFLMLSIALILFPRASVSALRVAEVLETDVTVKDPSKTHSFDGSKKGVVEFKNVSFHYPEAEIDALSDITFTANAGETTAFIGSTGSGKTTLVNLIGRFYDVTGGQLLVDGVDVREVSQKDLRDKIGYVPQKAVLFSGTIASNLRYADENATDTDIAAAAAIAQAEGFILEKDAKYEEPIAQGGTNVSGGQKQRLSIARALVKKPEIYIFDDSFSALDFRTDSLLRKALHEKVQGATMLIVAQRISTIMHADKIVVLDEGRIAGIGTHRELLASCEVYREIAGSQLSKEELDHE